MTATAAPRGSPALGGALRHRVGVRRPLAFRVSTGEAAVVQAAPAFHPITKLTGFFPFDRRGRSWPVVTR